MNIRELAMNAINTIGARSATGGGAEEDNQQETVDVTDGEDATDAQAEPDTDATESREREDGNEADNSDDDSGDSEEGHAEEQKPSGGLTAEAQVIAEEIGSDNLAVVQALFDKNHARELLPAFFDLVGEATGVTRSDLIEMLGGQPIPEGIDFEEWDDMSPAERQKAFEASVRREAEKQIKPIREHVEQARSVSQMNEWVDRNLEAVQKVFKAEGYDRFTITRARLLDAVAKSPTSMKTPETAVNAVKAANLDAILKAERGGKPREKAPKAPPADVPPGGQPETSMGAVGLKAMRENARRRGR